MPMVILDFEVVVVCPQGFCKVAVILITPLPVAVNVAVLTLPEILAILGLDTLQPVTCKSVPEVFTE